MTKQQEEQTVSVEALKHLRGDYGAKVPGDKFSVTRERAAELKANGLVKYTHASDESKAPALGSIRRVGEMGPLQNNGAVAHTAVGEVQVPAGQTARETAAAVNDGTLRGATAGQASPPIDSLGTGVRTLSAGKPGTATEPKARADAGHAKTASKK